MSAAAFLGIDWGTHSSKWACYLPTPRKYAPVFPMYSSDISSKGGLVTFGIPLRNDDDGARGLKGVLIIDPLGGAFWTSRRQDLDMSLGEAISFSLCCLLTDAFGAAHSSNLLTHGLIDVGVSFPNWLVDADRKSLAAARHFREAVAVALELANTVSLNDLPRPKHRFSLETWRQLVGSVRDRVTANLDDLSVEKLTQTIFPCGDKLRWGFITESGAAGLPYLRATKLEHVPGAPGLAKLLVVDIGAGSTDVGYMLRVQHRHTGAEKLYYFRPASSFPVAGNQLTQELMNHYRAAYQPITYAEAESRKLQQTRWTNLAFVDLWRARIAQHVKEYMAGVPDERWLPLPVTLNIVVTGGSGLVPALKERIKSSVIEALTSRNVASATLQKVVLAGEHLPRLRFETESEYARRAVCLGASDVDRPGCTYMGKMEAPFRVKFDAGKQWV